MNRSIELAEAINNSYSIHEDNNSGISSSFEKVYGVINSRSKSTGDDSERSHTDNSERSRSYVVSEEQAHSTTHTTEKVDETNWSETTEISHTDERTRMNINDFEEVKNETYMKRLDPVKDGDIENPSDYENFAKELYNIGENVVNTAKETTTGDIVCAAKNAIVPLGFINIFKDPTSVLKCREDVNEWVSEKKKDYDNYLTKTLQEKAKQNNNPNIKHDHLKRGSGAIKIGDAIISGGINAIGGLGNLVAMGDQSRLQRIAIRSQENIAIDQANLEYQLALAGTRSSSDTTTHSNTSGGSHSESDSWADGITKTSGISNNWGLSMGYSDAYTTGHHETSTVENSTSDSTSRMVNNNFNTETGWVNEESRTDTTTKGYSYGQTLQTNKNEELSYDDAIEISAQHIYESSNSVSKSEVKTKTIQVTFQNDSCQVLSIFPVFTTEVIIWATGYITKSKKTKITYNKSLVPVKLNGFEHNIVYCEDKYQYRDDIELINHDFDNFIFYKEESGPNINTLISGKYLKSGKSITSESGKYSFGLLPTGELVLCRDSVVKKGCDKIWSNGIKTLDNAEEHDLKFFIGDNGHLYITAKNIYKNMLDEVHYSNEFIHKIEEYVNEENDDKNDNLSKEKSKLKKKLLEYYEKNNMSTNSLYLQKRRRVPKDIGDDNTSNNNSEKSTIATTTTSPKIVTITSITNENTVTQKTDFTTTIALFSTPPTAIPEKTTNKISTTQRSTSTSNENEGYDSNNNSSSTFLTDEDYIIWDSLPKDLPFNVGFPDGKGYYLYIKDEKDRREEASVTLYDGVGVKIWEIRGNQKNYNGYAFPVEYTYPLSINTNLNKNEEYYDKHNVLDHNIVKDHSTNRILMNCQNVLNQNEALVSMNKQYRFYVQETGNMVIKDNSRTTWSSNTANIELFNGPYKIVFSPLGEIILRDTYNYSIWHSINALTLDNSDEENISITQKYKFYLRLTDDGELRIEDENEDVYWSNWENRLFSNHLRFINPVKYEINTCNEHIRSKHIYEIFAEANIYNYYKKVDDDTNDYISIKKYYFNNLLPGEALLSDYDAFLNVTETEAIFTYKTEKTVINSCRNNNGIEQLQLNIKGLFLYCNDGNIKTIITFEKDDEQNKYNRLSIEYRPNMEKPELMIFNVQTWDPIWKLSGIRYLNSLRNVNQPRWGKHSIINEDKIMSSFDRMYSSEQSTSDDFVYLSSITGLELKNSVDLSIKNIRISENEFFINNKILVNNNSNMELTYNGLSDKLILTNKTNHIWELYGSINICDYFISNNKTCNSIYAYNSEIINYLSPTELFPNSFFEFKNNELLYLDYYENKFNTFNIAQHIDTKDSIYSLILNDNGNIELNNGQYILHKEYYKPDEYYYLYVENTNLILKSSTGEYKWASNKIITNREYDADVIKIGDSFKEGEMLYCGDYSMIILDGKLIYRDHKKKTSTEVNYSSNNSAYLYEIDIGSNGIFFRDESDDVIDFISASTKSSNSKLRCEKKDRSVIWELGDNQILWKYPKNNLPIEELQDKSYVLLFNRYYHRCLYAPAKIGKNVRYENCDTNSNNFKWYFEIINDNSYLKSAIDDDICLIIDNDNIKTGKCSENPDKSLISYYNPKKYIKYNGLCISGIDEPNDKESPHYLTLTKCSIGNKKGIWEKMEDY